MIVMDIENDDDVRDDYNTKLVNNDDDDCNSSLDGELSLGGFSLGSLGEFE